MRGLIEATIAMFIISSVLIVAFAVLSDPLYTINDALEVSANASANATGQGNTTVVQDVKRVTGLVENSWIAVPVVFIIGTAFWYMMWGHKYERGRF